MQQFYIKHRIIRNTMCKTTRALDIVIFILCSIYYFQNNHFFFSRIYARSHGQYSTHISKEYYGQLTQTTYIWCFIKKMKKCTTQKLLRPFYYKSFSLSLSNILCRCFTKQYLQSWLQLGIYSNLYFCLYACY